MREEEAAANWYARWEEELPSPEELTPLSQTLITPDLALAFHIPTTTHNPSDPPPPPPPTEFDSGDTGCGGDDDHARALKRPRLVWTPQLHKRFVDAVAHLGIKNAVPKTIMQLMSVDGLTRENVASHLQKYRLYLKRVQGLAPSAGGGGGSAHISAADDRLFSSGPVPRHFLSRPEPFYVPVPTLQHHQQMAAAAAAQYYQPGQIGHFGSPTAAPAAGFERGFLPRAQPQLGMQQHRMVGPAVSYAEDLEPGSGGERRVLTLFPTGED